MNYQLVYTRRAEKDIKKLSPLVKKSIGKALLKLESNPLLQAEKMIDPKLGNYRLRVGDYRVIFDIESYDIIVLRIGHRRDIYRKL